MAAQELGLEVWQPETLRGAETAPQLQGAELLVVMAYGEILRQPVLDLPLLGCINLHGSLLPRWRGASPLQAAIRAGDTETGVTVMRMVRGLDAGPWCSRIVLPMPDRPTLPWLHDAMAQTAGQALAAFLEQIDRVTWTAQDESQVTVCRKLTSDDGRLDFSQPMQALDRWIRAYSPAPGCWAESASGERVRILAAEPRHGVPMEPGTVVVVGGELLVGCGDGAMVISRLQMPGGRAMAAGDFINGHAPPTRLG
ncbi:MAG: methionyl-tRNA formyltransferase [Planctomycetes bacterium]|nr:methionyl-tRNA formyltransferase [Planctomycetota bacterium]